MPKVSEEHLVARQEEILEAAIRCFSQSGFHATGMAEIIRESGLSAGSVYRYYKSKDELIAAVINRLIGGLRAQVFAVTADARSPGEAASRCVQMASRLLADGGSPATRILPQTWTEALRNPAISTLLIESYQPIMDHFEQLTRRMQERGDLDAGLNPVGVAQVMLSTVQGFMLQKLLFKQHVDDETFIRTAAHLFT